MNERKCVEHGREHSTCAPCLLQENEELHEVHREAWRLIIKIERAVDEFIAAYPDIDFKSELPDILDVPDWMFEVAADDVYSPLHEYLGD